MGYYGPIKLGGDLRWAGVGVKTDLPEDKGKSAAGR